MTKQLNLDLAAALEDAQQGRDNGEMLNKATADAMARSRQLNGKVAVRKATPEEMADKRNAFTGYNAGEGRRMGYVLEMLQPQRKERSGY